MQISVIIPTRHRNEQLALCLDRLAPGRQTLGAGEYEVIVTDDGSTSTAEAMIRQRYPWATWVSGPRKGPAANRNNGARAASGRWLAFTDDDCLPGPTWLASYLQAQRPEVEVYEGRTRPQGPLDILHEAPVNESGGCLWACNAMISNRLFGRIRGYDEDFKFWCEDMELNSRLKRLGVATRFVPEAIVEHPVRPRPRGWRAGARWEARVLLWYKEGNRSSPWGLLPLQLLRFRLGEIRRAPVSAKSLAALASTFAEFACVVTHLRLWDRKCRALMATRQPPLPSGITAAE